MRKLQSISGKMVTDQDIIDSCNQQLTMAKAAAHVGLHFNTFLRHAKRLGCYNPNQGRKGIHRGVSYTKISLDEILDGLHPSYHTYKLKLRLVKCGMKEHQCEECGLAEWNGKFLPIELDHIDGNRTNHRFSNLRMLCPNCHSQTYTYRSKNRQPKSAI